MRDGALAVGFALLGIAVAVLTVLQMGLERPGAYVRGYAAAVDSMRAQRPMFSDYSPAYYDTGLVKIHDEMYGYKRLGPVTYRFTRVWP